MVRFKTLFCALLGGVLISGIGMKSKGQDLGCNTCGTPNGSYLGTQNLVANDVGSHSIGPNTELNFIGGTNDTLLGPSRLTRVSIAYGESNLLEDSRYSAAIGANNEIISGRASMALGGENELSQQSYAFGALNDVSEGGVAVGANNNLNATDNYVFGEFITGAAQNAMTIGFGDGSNNRLENNLSNSITIGTDAANQLNINSNGNVAIGTNNVPRNAPGSKLEIRGDGSSSSTSSLEILDNSNNSLFYVRDDGFVGIQTNSKLGSRTEIFQLNGTGWASGDWKSPSDIRVKKDTQIISNAINKIMTLKGIKFFYKDNGLAKNFNFPEDRQAGIIAQELEKVLPEAVSQNGNGIYGVNYNAIIPLLIEANKSQQKQIEKLQKKTGKVDHLEQKLQQQKAKNQKLENRIEKLEKLVKEEYKNESKPGFSNDQKLKGNKLYQNSPNPFNQKTTIKYRLTEKVNEAQIVVTNRQGSEVNRFDISGTGYGEVTIQGGTLNPGNYIYSLVVDGKRVANRKMMLIRK